MTTTPTTPAPPRPIPRTARPGRSRWTRWAELSSPSEHALLALFAFIPLLAARAGVVTPDTKTYLYLDPGRFLSQVASMWNPTVGLGTVNHQYIGYLLPMGPFFGLGSALGLPVWVVQRLWLGAILMGAGAGALYLSRVLGLRGPGRMVGALAYMLSPYFLQYSGRISVILLPWAGLPWLVGLAAMALRRGGWRYPAQFSLVVALTSSINATAIIYVGIAPVLWLLYAVAVERDGTWREALACAGRLALLSALACLWWMVGLGIEAGYGVNVLKFTETVPSTSQTSTAGEVIRGLGYWYFYGGDRLGPWTTTSVLYTQWVWLILTSYLVPVGAFLCALAVRWRQRAFFIALVVVGLVLSVGAHPYAGPSAVGSVLKAFMSDTTAGLALRSTDRATPLVILGMAMLLGAGVTALWRRFARAGTITGLVLAALVIANNPALFNGDAAVASSFTQSAAVPGYLDQLAAQLNSTHPNLRVLEVPGDDFAAQRWGDTIDPALPALLSDRRPFAIHEQQIMGSQATADLLSAIDEPIQEGIEQWSALAPLARLISAGDVVVQNDTAYERYGIAQPSLLDAQLSAVPFGLSDPVSFGTPVLNEGVTSTLDEADLAGPANPTPAAPVVDYTVDAPRPLTRADSDINAVIVAGDATGLGELAAAGLLDTTSALYYSGTLDTKPAQLQSLVTAGAGLVVTDTNRKQAFRWDTLTANTGYTETPSEDPAASDPSDSPIDLFPGLPVGAHTVASDVGALTVTASSYGNPVSYTPENRAFSAIDDNLDTAWETGVFDSDPAGQWWQVALPNPVRAGQVTVVQTQHGDLSRHITEATLTFDGHESLRVHLDASSLSPAGQVIRFPARTFGSLRITIDSTSDDVAPVASASQVGLAEVEIPGVHVQEVIAMPTDLLDKVGPSSLTNRLTFVMARDRTSPFPTRSDPETTIDRDFTIPTARTFSLSGTASLSALIPDDEIDRLVGRPTTGSGIDAYSSGRLPGSLESTASAALDGQDDTLWQPGFGSSFQTGDSLNYTLPKVTSISSLNLAIVADGRHSVPTALSVSDGSETRTITVPPLADNPVAGAVTDVAVDFPTLTTRHLTITVTKVRGETTTNYFSPTPLGLPLGVAEVGIPGEQASPVPAVLPGTCEDNLLAIDGHPVPLEVVGASAAALDNQEMTVKPCGADEGGITLGPGTHMVETALGHAPSTGWSIDQLVLDSAPGGGPEPTGAFGTLPASKAGSAPAVYVTSQDATGQSLSVAGADLPFELVLGESQNGGWHAVADPAPGAPPGAHAVDLGPSELVDGYANGWPVDAAQLRALGATGPGGSGTFRATLTWTPQRVVVFGLVVSGLALVLCLVLGYVPLGRFWPRRRTAERGRHRSRVVPAAMPSPAGALRPPHPPDDFGPVLAATLSHRGGRPSMRTIAVVALGAGIVAGLITNPLIGLLIALASALTLFVPAARGFVALGAVVVLVIGVLSVAFGQWSNPMIESSNWPNAHEGAGTLIWAATAYLGADAAVEITRRLTGRLRGGPNA